MAKNSTKHYEMFGPGLYGPNQSNKSQANLDDRTPSEPYQPQPKPETKSSSTPSTTTTTTTTTTSTTKPSSAPVPTSVSAAMPSNGSKSNTSAAPSSGPSSQAEAEKAKAEAEAAAKSSSSSSSSSSTSSKDFDRIKWALNKAEAKIAKRKADHDWYMRNVKIKQAYNKEYYENNREYWLNLYKKKLAEAKAYPSDKAPSQFLKLELNETKRNWTRAEREYQEFLEANAKIPVTEAWAIGAKTIIATGARFIKKWGRKRLDKIMSKNDNLRYIAEKAEERTKRK